MPGLTRCPNWQRTDAAFDLVISNGALNLVPGKATAFAEIARVLRSEGAFVAADLLVVNTIPSDVLESMDSWSTRIAGALTGRSYMAALHVAGFRSGEILDKTGYGTSRFTEASYILAKH